MDYKEIVLGILNKRERELVEQTITTNEGYRRFLEGYNSGLYFDEPESFGNEFLLGKTIGAKERSRIDRFVHRNMVSDKSEE